MLERKQHPILKIMNASLVDLPAPSNLSHLWNFGSLLGFCMLVQTLSGIFLAMQYSSDTSVAFSCVDHIMRDVSNGWFIRLMHANGASLFFIAIYCHIGRNLYYRSYQSKMAWTTGIVIFLISMMTAFLGYVLPWGQMSYWGATVITNLLSALPYVGKPLVEWVWGGFSVDNATLSRFFALHFVFPFVIFALIISHLVFIHEFKSSNPMGLESFYDKIPFHPYFSLKDTMNIFIVCFFFMSINMTHPFSLMDPDNFIPANPLSTPSHIQPEWYFLFAYAILRAIPNKLGGVLSLLASILILFLFLTKNTNIQFSKTSTSSNMFWFFCLVFLFLTYLGTKPVELPFTTMSQLFTALYFSWFFI